MGVADSVGWCVDTGVGAALYSADVITFGVDDGSDMGSSDEFFDSSNYRKLVG